MPEVVLWDSCVIIDAIQENPNTYPCLLPMIKKAEAGELYIVISSAQIAEVKYLRELAAQGISQDAQSELIDAWLNSDYVIPRNADRGVCQYAVQLARQVGSGNKNLTPLDSIVLSTALLNGSEALITMDGGNRDSVGLLDLSMRFGSPQLPILHPCDYVRQYEMDLK